MNKRRIIESLKSLEEDLLSQREKAFVESLAKYAERLDDFSELDESQLVLFALDALDKDERDLMTGLKGHLSPEGDSHSISFIEIFQMMNSVLKAIGEDCREEMKTYCDASMVVLHQKVSAFLREAHRLEILDFSGKKEWEIKFRCGDNDVRLRVLKRRGSDAAHFKFEKNGEIVLYFLSGSYYDYDLHVVEVREELCDCIATINAITKELA